MNRYNQAVEAYVEKAIEELHFEDLLILVKDEHSLGDYLFSPCKNIEYRFSGRVGIFGNVWIESGSLSKRVEGRDKTIVLEDFIIELNNIVGMDELTLAQFIEEANQTIYGDLIFKERFETIKNDFLSLDFHAIDSALPGHPKILNNKGRIGWGANEFQKFAPESGSRFKLHWLAVKRDQILVGLDNNFLKEAKNDQFFLNSTQSDLSEIYEKCNNLKISLEDYIVFPVHPWQWNRYIQIQYRGMLEESLLVSLGEWGPDYSAQASIRTLSNCESKEMPDMKLSVSILNTSSYRGIPQRFIENGYKVSRGFEKVVDEDNFLRNKVLIAKEVGALSVLAGSFSRLKTSPSRFNEMLGCIVRESVPSLLKEGQSAYPVSAFFFRESDSEKNYSFVKELITESEMTYTQWFGEYFKNVVIPLYYLQVIHGIGIVAHGQNVVAFLEEGIPRGIILKDFHGDLRMSDQSVHLKEEWTKSLSKLPPQYLIHDLLTGHFVTVLRYLARVCHDFKMMSEAEFFKLLNQEINQFYKDNDINIPPEMNLLRDEFEKLQVNNVRFKIGYKETSGSPKPLVGKNIKNPIVYYNEGEKNEL